MSKCVFVFNDKLFPLLKLCVALANGDDFLLFWINIVGFCVPFVLLVRYSLLLFLPGAKLTGLSIYSMRYSRMLEESSFANKKADYFWLLLQSSVMLLVNTVPFPHFLLILIFSSQKDTITFI